MTRRVGLAAACGVVAAAGLEVATYRIAAPDGPAVTRLVYEYVMEPGSLIMERKMLLGIKERAERLSRTDRDVDI